jgi:site-specific DNA-methyltransferase (adenine-specific)
MSEYRLFHGDCLDVLPSLEDASIDAIIADIPSGRTACAWDSVIPFDLMWAQLKRIIKPRGAIVLLGCTQPFTSALVMSNVEMFKYDWAWLKHQPTNFLNCNKQPMRQHESIVVFAYGSHNYYPQKQQRAGAGIKMIGKAYNEHGPSDNYGTYAKGATTRAELRYPSSFQWFHSSRRGLQHPTQKPLALLEYLVRTYTNAGDTVLDFCYGSGTTGHACANLERSFIGIEKDAIYFASGENRIASAYAPLRAMQQAAQE